MLGKVLFFLSLCLWLLFTVLSGWISRGFVFSKPPGRRMITADINAIIYITGNLTTTVHCLSIAARTLLGPLPTYMVFAINEAMVLTVSLSLGVCNVNAFFHILLIFHPR